MKIKGITPPVDCQHLVNTPPTDQRTDRSITYNPRKCHQRIAITSPTHGEDAVYMSPNYHHASPDPYQSTTARGYNWKYVSNLDQLGEPITCQKNSKRFQICASQWSEFDTILESGPITCHNNSKRVSCLCQSMVITRNIFRIWAHHVPEKFKTRFSSMPANGQNSKMF